MDRDIAQTLITHEQIARRVQDLASQITADHTPATSAAAAAAAEAEMTIVPIMTGAMIFCGDLIRQIPIPIRIGLMMVSSYPGRSVKTQGSQLLSSQVGDIRGRHVVVLDDILDSGGTLRMVVPALKEMGAASVKSCVLLRKDRPAAHDVHVDYVGFEIPDAFVVGYGLDFNDYYRNLPDIVTLTEEAIARKR